MKIPNEMAVIAGHPDLSLVEDHGDLNLCTNRTVIAYLQHVGGYFYIVNNDESYRDLINIEVLEAMIKAWRWVQAKLDESTP